MPEPCRHRRQGRRHRCRLCATCRHFRPGARPNRRVHIAIGAIDA
ncbi:hypothetical protein I552_1571 [Mycobacterium xenopi 3993]|nr:hypothetical protein I552_1571 [Mycobacterium xenopi 3993]